MWMLSCNLFTIKGQSLTWMLCSVSKILAAEEDDEKTTDSLGGCRSGKNLIKSDEYRTSGGTVAIMSLDGFLCSLTEVLHTESQTEVILRIYETFALNNDSHIHYDYFCRMIVAFGYDMMCNILERLLSRPMQQLMDRDELVKGILYFFDALGLHRLFIDKMHISTHKHTVCQNDEVTGLLHPHLSKFKGILNGIKGKVNEQQVEQLWKITNVMNSMRLLCPERFGLALILQREHHNHENKNRLEEEGYCWEPICNWKSLRETSIVGLNQFDMLKRISELTQSKMLQDIQRIRFRLKENVEYRNVWTPRDEVHPVFKVNLEQKAILRGVRAHAQYRKNQTGTVHIAEIKVFLTGWKSADVWERFKVIITEYINSL